MNRYNQKNIYINQNCIISYLDIHLKSLQLSKKKVLFICVAITCIKYNKFYMKYGNITYDRRHSLYKIPVNNFHIIEMIYSRLTTNCYVVFTVKNTVISIL